MRERVEVRTGVRISKGDGGFRWVSLQKGHQDLFFIVGKETLIMFTCYCSFFWGENLLTEKVSRMGSCAFADFF